jgi:hypothetical protein
LIFKKGEKEMSIKLQPEPTFRALCVMGRDEAKALLNIFDCMMDNEDGYSDLENILDYRVDNALSNIDKVREELDNFVSRKKEQIFNARLDSAAEDRIRQNRSWAIGE